jgi:Zn-finger nucleic acid-binding protein
MHLQDGSEAFVCDYCSSTFVPEQNDDGIRVFDEVSNLPCPVCKTPLAHATLDHERFFYCNRCRGCLIPMTAFVELIADLRLRRGTIAGRAHPPDPRLLDRVINCPQCGRRMDTHYYAGGGNVVIDDCSPCELNWLDAGELLTIARTPDRSLDRPPLDDRIY